MVIFSPYKPPVTVEPRHANNFDAIRFFLAICVIFTHSFILSRHMEDPFSRFSPTIDLGHVAVSGFFLLSGYLITQSWLRSKSVWDYLKRRALRIYPAFVVVCLICAVLVGPIGAVGPIGTVSRAAYWHNFPVGVYINHLLTLRLIKLPPVFKSIGVTNVNGSLWTINPEFLSYLCVIGLGYCGFFQKRNRLLVLTAALFVVDTLIRYEILSRNDYTQVISATLMLPGLLWTFLLGSAFYLYRDRIVYSRYPLLLSLIVTALLMHFGKLFATLSLPFFGYVLFGVAFSRHIRLHNFAKYGDFSYGLYLYAFPIQILLIWYFRLDAWMLFAAACPLTLVCAMLSWYLVEKPCLRWKGRRTVPQKTTN